MGATESATEQQSTAKMLGIVFIASFLVGTLVVFAEYYAVAPRGSVALKSLMVFMVFPFLLSVAAIPGAMCLCISRKLRRTAFHVLLSCLLFAAMFQISIRLGGRLRIRGFDALAERSAPLVDAIKTYEQVHGAPPPALHALVPEFIPAIPDTGMAAYPRFEYRVGKEKSYGGNPWTLEVFTPSGILNFDRFLYFPLQNYDSWCCDPIERVGDWAYVHE